MVYKVNDATPTHLFTTDGHFPNAFRNFKNHHLTLETLCEKMSSFVVMSEDGIIGKKIAIKPFVCVCSAGSDQDDIRSITMDRPSGGLSKFFEKAEYIESFTSNTLAADRKFKDISRGLSGFFTQIRDEINRLEKSKSNWFLTSPDKKIQALIELENQISNVRKYPGDAQSLIAFQEVVRDWSDENHALMNTNRTRLSFFAISALPKSAVFMNWLVDSANALYSPQEKDRLREFYSLSEVSVKLGLDHS